MQPTVIHSAGVVPEPWANGGGVTRELLRADDSAWRVSLADIDRNGPFSSLPGSRRLLTVVHGTVLRLVVDGVESVVEPGRPFAFDGGAEVFASLPEGPVRALNVIVAGGAVEPFVTVLELGRSSVLPLAGDQAALVTQGHAVVQGVDVPAFALVAGPGEVSGRCTLAVLTLQHG